MLADHGEPIADLVLRVDGGMSANDWTMQFLADMLDVPVERPAFRETTAMGAGYLAGLDAGVYPEPDEFARDWSVDRRFNATMDEPTRAARYRGWQRAVRLATMPDED
jgi:glycerol kinase